MTERDRAPGADERRALIAAADDAAARLAARQRFVALGLLLRMKGMVDDIAARPSSPSGRVRHMGFVLHEMVDATRSARAQVRAEYEALCAHFDAMEALCDRHLGPRAAPPPSEDDLGRMPAAARPLASVLLGVARQAELIRAAEQADAADLDRALAINAARCTLGRRRLAAEGSLEAALDAWLAWADGFR